LPLEGSQRPGRARITVMPARCSLLLNLGILLGAAGLCPAEAPSPKHSSGAAARSEAADKADFEKVCGSCHASSMVSDIRSEPEWKQTIEQMVSIGAEGTEGQMAAVMRYLLRNLTKVNVNKATAEELPLVLDMSKGTTQAVVMYRAKHGDFKTLDDLKKVPGINAAKLEARKNRVVF
jgi:competence protein ComEA